MPATYEPIATTTLGSAASSITFSSIPATYTDLRVVITCTTSAVQNLVIRLNSDTASNYSVTYLSGDGATAQSGALTSQTYIRVSAIGSTSITVPTFGSVDLFSYAGSTNKTVLSTFSSDLNGSGAVDRSVGLWRSTAAINTILLYATGTSVTLSTGTIATLYGIKNA